MIKTKLEQWIKETLGLEKVVLEHPTDLVRGDFAYVSQAKNPEEDLHALRQTQGDLLLQIEKIELVNGRFINFFLSKEFFAESLQEIIEFKETFGKGEMLKREKIFFEHTQPNPFKEFHIGHLMNNAIGESLSRIIKANGAEVKTATYHGDVGLHIANAIWGLESQPELSHSLGAAYALGNKAYGESEDVKIRILDINKKIYDRSDDEVNRLYDEGRKNSFEYFESLYKRLGSDFDFHFYESQSGLVGKKLVEEHIGIVFEESEGAVIFRGENFEPKTHTRVFLNKEKLPTYEAKEVGLAEIKKETWNYTSSVTVTANEQDSFFKVVEVAIGEIFPELKGKLRHASHGLLKLPTGKMSSRTGDVITAESLIAEVKDKVLEKIKDLDFSEEEKENIAEIVAIGAIKYTILRQSVGGDIIFDVEKSISFEGDSGPYLQYTVVRANAVLEKAHEQNYTTKFGGTKGTLVPTGEVERILYRFPEIVERAATDYSPHHLVNFLTELAASFNSFYAQNKIIDETNVELSEYRLALTKAVSIVLTNGLDLLGIKVPERM